MNPRQPTRPHRALQDTVDIPLDARYRVIAELPGGGAADVFVAVDDQRTVVLKTPRRGFADDEHAIDGFRREARLAARLRHPHVVEVFDVVEDHNLPVIVMEFLDGASLRDLTRELQKGHILPLRGHLEILRQVCLGLHYCHELRSFDGAPLGLVHRDVSPHNVFITVNGTVKLLDFGIAKLSGFDSGTQTGVIKGKLRYMAPEQMQGDTIDRRADIYAVGIMLWEAATNRSLWGDAVEAQIISATVNGNMPAIDTSLPDVSENLASIIRRCMALWPQQRFNTALELADALEDEIQSLPPTETDLELGKFVATVFAERRERLRSMIEGTADQSLITTGPIDWQNGQTGSRSAVTTNRSHPTSSSAPSPPARWTVVLSVTFAVLLLIGTSAVAFQALGSLWIPPARGPNLEISELPVYIHSVDNAGPGIRPEPVSGRHGNVPTTLRLAIAVVPRESAVVLLDGQTMKSPYQVELAADGELHTVTIAAPNYHSVSRTVVFDHDIALDVELEPLPDTETPADISNTDLDLDDAKPKKRHRTSPSPSPSHPSSTSKTGSRSNCDPPFFIDKNGFKRFKRACL